MIPILSNDGLSALRSLMEKRPLLAFDFDGTLAPLQPHPEKVQLLPNVRQILEQLNERTPVAIVSGRARTDILRYFPKPLSFVIGNHGAEWSDRDEDEPDETAVARAWKAYLTPLLHGDAWIEDKAITLSVHSRTKDILDELYTAVDQALATLPPIRILPGIHCINIIPQGTPSKADTLMRLLRETGCSRALYIGDDETDEDVFALKDPRILTIHVGQRPSQATYVLEEQEKIEELLKTLREMPNS